MALTNLLSTGDKAYFTGELGNHFFTFQRNITIHKEPRKVVKQAAANIYFGYNDSSNSADYDYQPVSGIYPAVVTYRRFDQQDMRFLVEPKASINKNRCQVKIEESGKTFIQEGKTENITVDGQSYNIMSQPITQNFLGLVYYIYELEATF